MMDLVLNHLDVIITAVFGLGFLWKFVAAKKLALRMAAIVQSIHSGAADSKWEPKEYERVGRAVVPFVEELKTRMGGLFGSNTTI